MDFYFVFFEIITEAKHELEHEYTVLRDNHKTLQMEISDHVAIQIFDIFQTIFFVLI